MPSMKDLYLMTYNATCCAGWAVVWVLTVQHLIVTGGDSSTVYSTSDSDNDDSNVGVVLARSLQVSQMAAVLEIVHAALKLVRSPVLVTFMQVSSRVVALLALVYSQKAQSQWGSGIMILSWASVEVPRYAFYLAALITGDATKKTPYWLFWLRYSLFAVLYPTGIVGELTCFLAAAKDDTFVQMFSVMAPATVYGTLLPIIYFFGSPFMILNMAANRSSAMKKRFAKPPPPPRGLCWPEDQEKGERSSTKVNQVILAAAVGAVNDQKAKDILQSRAWRFTYHKHLQKLVEEQCTSSEACLNIAQAGLRKAYEVFEFIYDDGKAVSFEEAMAQPPPKTPFFFTHHIKGTGSNNVQELQVPYKGQILKGQALKDQVQKWVDYGTIEPSAGDAICKCVDNPDWFKNNIQNRYFVLLGAGSAMGPLLVLLAIGANVVAIDLDRPQIWQRLITLARQSTGTITFPVKVDPSTLKTDDELFAAAGANLFTHTPMIRDWLMDLYPGKPFTVGSYAYLNGALHVQVSLAMDAICKSLSEKRKDVSLAYLCTPTDFHLTPKEAHEAALANYEDYKKRPYCMLLSLLSSGKLLRKNAKKPIPSKDGSATEYYLVNGISVAQGPNYALAKRLQHWRAIIARNVQGCVVSSNIAPSTSTVSVVQNRTFAWAYEGMPYFKPYEIFAPETSNAVMSAILFHDLNDASSSGNPQTVLSNPNQLFSYGSFHGGVWRCAYEIDSIGEASVFLYFGRLAQPYLMGVGAVAAAGAAAYYGMSS